MDGSAFNHIGNALSAFLTAVAVLFFVACAAIVACIGMGIYIYVH